MTRREGFGRQARWSHEQLRGGRRTEGKLADNAANVRAGLDEALEIGGELATLVEAELEHGGDGGDDEEVVRYAQQLLEREHTSCGLLTIEEEPNL